MADASLTLNDPGGASDGEHEEVKGTKGSGKSRRELPVGAVATLKAWLLSPEHFTHPYPTPQDQAMLMQKTGIEKKQLKNWFTNARRRIWKPMLKKQLEQGKLTATGAGGGGVAVPGVFNGLMVPAMPEGVSNSTEQHVPSDAAPGQPVAVLCHPAVQKQQQSFDAYGNVANAHQTTPRLQTNPGSPESIAVSSHQYHNQSYNDSSAPKGATSIAAASSIGSLPTMGGSPPTGTQTGLAAHMSKNDSHAVLMELFARDQDLVRQATESAKLRVAAKRVDGDQKQDPVSNHHLVKFPSQGSRLGPVPTLNSWPKFSSISSLNNLGTMTGVKSITSLSGADLASQGNLNKMGNLAQVKSIENMGQNDSYAFLEFFFGDRGASVGPLGGKETRGVKRERDEDNDVGLSLDADESPSMSTLKPGTASSCLSDTHSTVVDSPQQAHLVTEDNTKDKKSEKGTLKRAYEDALAARGLMSVSRSCEKLTDLALPAKMQRTLSQEYLRQQNLPSAYSQANYSSSPRDSECTKGSPSRQQCAGQHPSQQQQPMGSGKVRKEHESSSQSYNGHPNGMPERPTTTNSSVEHASVEVPSATKCALCGNTNVDTQLRPCGHMFHEGCLKPSLQNSVRPPKCPIDHIPMQSAVLAVPTEDPRC